MRRGHFWRRPVNARFCRNASCSSLVAHDVLPYKHGAQGRHQEPPAWCVTRQRPRRARTVHLVTTTKPTRPSGHRVLATRHTRRHRRRDPASPLPFAFVRHHRRRDPVLSPPFVFVTVPSPTASITLQVRETDSADKYTVSGWGQLHLTVLIFEPKAGPPLLRINLNNPAWCGQVLETPTRDQHTINPLKRATSSSAHMYR